MLNFTRMSLFDLKIRVNPIHVLMVVFVTRMAIMCHAYAKPDSLENIVKLVSLLILVRPKSKILRFYKEIYPKQKYIK